MKTKINTIRNKKIARYAFSLIMVLISAFLQAYVILAFIRPTNLLSSGFTGVAILIDKIANLYGGSIDTSLAIICLNVPIALICYKRISPKFTFFSCIQFFATSLFLKILHFDPLFDDLLLNIAFGGFAYGIGCVAALKGNASTGGTDFIALYVSNRINRSIWEYVFVFNTFILCIFGAMFGWQYAGYSIIFQFISTKTISTFHHRYDRVTLQIVTSNPEEVVDAYVEHYRHGISVLPGYGGYSRKQIFLLNTVVSSYEVRDIVDLLKDVDRKIIVNVFKTENFFGGFYSKPID